MTTQPSDHPPIPPAEQSEYDKLVRNLDDAEAWRAAGCPAGLVTGAASDTPWVECIDCSHPKELHYEGAGLCQATNPPGCECDGFREPPRKAAP